MALVAKPDRSRMKCANCNKECFFPRTGKTTEGNIVFICRKCARQIKIPRDTLKKLDCLKDCNGACCKILLIPMRGDLPEDYQKARGIQVVVYGEKKFLAVHHPCKYLLDNGQCAIYGRRPALCASQPPGCDECLICRDLVLKNKL